VQHCPGHRSTRDIEWSRVNLDLTEINRLLELDQLGLRSITKTDCADDDAKLAAALQPKPQVAPDDRGFRDAMTAVFAVDTLEGLENFLKVAT
jgi:hypothetical protein